MEEDAINIENIKNKEDDMTKFINDNRYKNDCLVIDNKLVTYYDVTNYDKWYPLPVHKRYDITASGKIRNVENMKELKQSEQGNHLRISFIYSSGSKKGFLIHRLVAITFIPNPDNKPTVDHIDINPYNNHYTNLRWADYDEQAANKNKFECKRSARQVWKINKDTNEKIELYDTLKDAGKWILANGLAPNNISEKAADSVGSLIGKAAEKNKIKYEFKWEYENNEIEGEIWEEIHQHLINYPGDKYYVSNLGRIKTPHNRITKGCPQFKGKNSYMTIGINGNTKLIHLLVASVFIPNPDNKKIVNHKDKDKKNSNVNNLEWVTSSENAMHSINNGGNSRIKPITQYDMNWNKIANFKSCKHAAKALNLIRRNINFCVLNSDKRKSVDGYKFQYIREFDFNGIIRQNFINLHGEDNIKYLIFENNEDIIYNYPDYNDNEDDDNDEDEDIDDIKIETNDEYDNEVDKNYINSKITQPVIPKITLPIIPKIILPITPIIKQIEVTPIEITQSSKYSIIDSILAQINTKNELYKL